MTLYCCHCTECQGQASSAFGMSLIVEHRQIEILQGEDRIRHWETRGDDGEIKRCAYCPECGSRLYHAGEDPARTSIKAGSLDHTDDLEPVAHIWLRSAQPWISIEKLRFSHLRATAPAATRIVVSRAEDRPPPR